MNITLTLPCEWLEGSHPMYQSLKTSDALRRRMVVELLQSAMQSLGIQSFEKAPDSGPEGNLRVMIYLPARLASYVTAVARASGLPPGAAAKAIIHKHWVESGLQGGQLAVSADTNPLVVLLAGLHGREQRAEQVAVFNTMEDALSSRRIGLVEASTGVGKTLAAVFAMARWTESNGASATIAVPTISLLHQTKAEYRAIADVRAMPPLRVYLGRREFVSQAACAALCSASEGRWPAVEAWMSQGAPAAVCDGLDASWLAASLLSLEPEFPIQDVLLGEVEEEGDAGMSAYASQFSDRPVQPCIILCTHAMLAQDMRRRLRNARRDEDFAAINNGVLEALSGIKGLSVEDRIQASLEISQSRREMGQILSDEERITGVLPSYQALLVDEAHALEGNFSSALSDYLSLRKLHRQLSEYRDLGGKVTASALDEVATLISAVSQSGRGHAPVEGEFIALSASGLDEMRQGLADIANILSPVVQSSLKKPSHAKARLHADLRRAFNMIQLALTRAGSRSYIRFSPHRHFPQLYLGRDNVETVLQLMWSSLSSGIALSATLYLYRSNGPHAGYISSLLGIPDDRRAEYAPIEAGWLYDPVMMVDVPDGERARKLRPPTRRDRLSEPERRLRLDAWLDEVSTQLRLVHQTSAGGVLVLNTSYDMVAGLSSRLADSDIDLVIAGEGKGVSAQVKTFLQLSLQGRKPMWLAVGGAWTGLDVGGHTLPILGNQAALPAYEDNVLTDLVVPRLPFGTNNSITHLKRLQTRPSVPWDVLDAGFRFRQALGRLVRRKGLPANRRVWVLDGRLSEPNSRANLAIFWAPIDRIRQKGR